MRGGEERRHLDPRQGIGGRQQVHRPIRLVVVHPPPRAWGLLRRTRPLGRRQLAPQIDRAVTDLRRTAPGIGRGWQRADAVLAC